MKQVRKQSAIIFLRYAKQGKYCSRRSLRKKLRLKMKEKRTEKEITGHTQYFHLLRVEYSSIYVTVYL